MIITTAWLRKHKARDDQVELFGRIFGDGVELNPTTIRAAADAGFDIHWFTKMVLPAPARAEHERVEATALAKYARVMAPVLIEYLRATPTARAEYDRVAATALSEYLRVNATALIGILWPEASGEAGNKL